MVVKRSLSWQFWKTSTTPPPAAGVDPWPTNATQSAVDPITIVPPSSIIPDVPKIEADEFGYIPEPPTIPSDVPIEFLLNSAGEPALSTLGLGKWYLPTGWVQQGLDFIHADLGLPWWATIMIGRDHLRAIRRLLPSSRDLGHPHGDDTDCHLQSAKCSANADPHAETTGVARQTAGSTYSKRSVSE